MTVWSYWTLNKLYLSVPEVKATASPLQSHNQNLGIWQPAWTYRALQLLPVYLLPISALLTALHSGNSQWWHWGWSRSLRYFSISQLPPSPGLYCRPSATAEKCCLKPHAEANHPSTTVQNPATPPPSCTWKTPLCPADVQCLLLLLKHALPGPT